MLKQITLFLLIIFSFSCLGETTKVIKVGLIQEEPPISFFQNKNPSGIAYDLLKNIAKQEHLRLQIIPIESEKQGYTDLTSKKIDLIAGAVSPALSHNLTNTFSLPFMVDSVTVATKHSQISFNRLFEEMERTLFWDILLAALLGQILFSFILWIVERSKHEEFISRGIIKGYGYANWAILSAFLRDLIFEPKTTGGRIVMGAWLVASVIFMTVLASSVTVSIVNISSVYHSPIKRAADLRNIAVGVHSHDSLLETINKLGVRAVPEKSESVLLENLENNKYKAVIDNSVMLDYFLGHHPNLQVGLTGLILRTNYFSYVLRAQDPMLHDIDHGLIRVQSGIISKAICEKYLSKHINECAL